MTAVLKKGRATQRLHVLAEIDFAAVDLTGKVLETIMAAEDGGETPQMLASTMLVPQSGFGLGRFEVDVTLANLMALGNPDKVLIVWNIWNADGSLCIEGKAIFGVVL